MDWSHLFAIGLTLQGPRNGFLGFSTRSGFFDVVWVSGYFSAKSDKMWVSEALQFFTAFYYQFTDDNKFHDLTLQPHSHAGSSTATLARQPAAKCVIIRAGKTYALKIVFKVFFYDDCCRQT